jgi:hypothetical protein
MYNYKIVEDSVIDKQNTLTPVNKSGWHAGDRDTKSAVPHSISLIVSAPFPSGVSLYIESTALLTLQ